MWFSSWPLLCQMGVIRLEVGFSERPEDLGGRPVLNCSMCVPTRGGDVCVVWLWSWLLDGICMTLPTSCASFLGSLFSGPLYSV